MLHARVLCFLFSSFCPTIPILGIKIVFSCHFLQHKELLFIFFVISSSYGIREFSPAAIFNLISVFPSLIHLCFISIWLSGQNFCHMSFLSYYSTFHFLLQRIQVILLYIENTDIAQHLFFFSYSKIFFKASFLNGITIRIFFSFVIVEFSHMLKMWFFFFSI